jgi:hypothetical protein
MNRRTLFKTTLAALAAVVTGTRQMIMAKPSSRRNGVRLVVFGVDALRHDSALLLRGEGSPALASLNTPICVLSGGGYSMTQPEWASVWSGLCCVLHRTYKNNLFNAMPTDTHIMGRLMKMYPLEKFFPVWITGKGYNIKGDAFDSPHFQVYKPIVLDGRPGVYMGDRERENEQVYTAASKALQEAITNDNFCCFIHFHDPDQTGHKKESYNEYLDAAREVDQYVYQLMQILPPDTEIIYCSDHGFNFTELGEVENNHHFAPRGMLSTNFILANATHASRQSVGRLIYKLAGGNPDFCETPSGVYSMYGVDLMQ